MKKLLTYFHRWNRGEWPSEGFRERVSFAVGLPFIILIGVAMNVWFWAHPLRALGSLFNMLAFPLLGAVVVIGALMLVAAPAIAIVGFVWWLLEGRHL
jgi:Competence protein